MKKSEIIAALESIPGDPEIIVTMKATNYSDPLKAEIDRINQFPRPEIVVVKKCEI